MRTSLLRAVILGISAMTAHAADPGARTYSDPACSSRTANPDDCVIQDGPPRRPVVGQEPTKPPDIDKPKPPGDGASFTPPKDKPVVDPRQQAGTSFTPPSKAGNPPSPQSGTSFTAPKKGK